MIIRFVCPFGHRLAAHPDSAGAKAQCPECLAVLYVPSPQPRTSGKVKKVWNAPQPIQDVEALVQSALGDDFGAGDDADVPEDAFIPLDDAPSEVFPPRPAAPAAPIHCASTDPAPAFVGPPGKSVAALAAAEAASRVGLAARTSGPNPAERGVFGSYPPPSPTGGRSGPGSSVASSGAARTESPKPPAAAGNGGAGGSAASGPGSGVGRSLAASGYTPSPAAPGSSTYGAAAARSGAASPAAASPVASAAAATGGGAVDSSSRLAPLRWDDLPTTAPATESAPTSSIHTAGGSTVSVGRSALDAPAGGVEAAPVGGPPAASSPLHPPNYAAGPNIATTRSGVPYPETSPAIAPSAANSPPTLVPASGGIAASSVLPALGAMGAPAPAPTATPSFSSGGTTSFPAPNLSGAAATSFPAPAPSAFAPSPFAPSPFAAPSAAPVGTPGAPSAFAPSPFAPSPFAPSPFAAPQPIGAETPTAGPPQVLGPAAFGAPAGGTTPLAPVAATPVEAKPAAAPFAFPADSGSTTEAAPAEAPIIISNTVEKKSLWQAAGPARLWKLYLLALCVAFYAVASGLPTYHFLASGESLPLWAKIGLGLAATKLLYALFMAVVPDWSTVWLGMAFLALLSVLYGFGWILAAFTAPGAAMPLGLDAVREHLKFWCVLMGLSSLGLSVVCARFSHQWRRDFELALKAAREAKMSRVAPPTLG